MTGRIKGSRSTVANESHKKKIGINDNPMPGNEESIIMKNIKNIVYINNKEQLYVYEL